MTERTAPAVQFGLKDRVVVVTGAAHGIGQACARRLAGEHARVALWDVDGDAAAALAAELQVHGYQATACACDVSKAPEVSAALAATLRAFDRIDALVNNAGIFRAADFLEVTEADWDAVIGVNLKGAFLCGQAVARQIGAHPVREALRHFRQKASRTGCAPTRARRVAARRFRVARPAP